MSWSHVHVNNRPQKDKARAARECTILCDDDCTDTPERSQSPHRAHWPACWCGKLGINRLGSSHVDDRWQHTPHRHHPTAVLLPSCSLPGSHPAAPPVRVGYSPGRGDQRRPGPQLRPGHSERPTTGGLWVRLADLNRRPSSRGSNCLCVGLRASGPS